MWFLVAIFLGTREVACLPEEKGSKQECSKPLGTWKSKRLVQFLCSENLQSKKRKRHSKKIILLKSFIHSPSIQVLELRGNREENSNERKKKRGEYLVNDRPTLFISEY